LCKNKNEYDEIEDKIVCGKNSDDGKIKDVYMHYGFDSDPKDVKRNKESKRNKRLFIILC
jgi:hypothetical protein